VYRPVSLGIPLGVLITHSNIEHREYFYLGQYGYHVKHTLHYSFVFVFYECTFHHTLGPGYGDHTLWRRVHTLIPRYIPEYGTSKIEEKTRPAAAGIAKSLKGPPKEKIVKVRASIVKSQKSSEPERPSTYLHYQKSSKTFIIIIITANINA